MKKFGWLVLGLCLGAPVCLQAELYFTDDFNDGVRNQTKWKAVSNGAKLRETEGHLFAHSGVTDPGNGPLRVSQWRAKTTFGLLAGNILAIEAEVRMPELYMGANDLAVAILSIGCGDPTFDKTALLSIGMFERQRVAYGYVEGENTTLWQVDGSANRFWIKLRYNRTTGMVNFYIKYPGGKWLWVGNKDLDAIFGVPNSTDMVRLVPFIEFKSILTWVQPGTRVYVDNFKATLH